MPIESRSRLRTPFAPALDLPPPFRLVTLREAGDAFAHATAIAADAGAGTLVHVGRFDLAEFAVVLEPDEPLRTARRAFYAGMAALADALAAHAPPGKPIAFDVAGRDRGRRRARRRRAPGVAAGRRRGRDAGLARLRRHDPHRRDGRGGAGPASARHRARRGRFRRSRLRPAGRKLCAPSHGRDRRLAGERIRRGGQGYLARLKPEPGLRRDIEENGDLLMRRMAVAGAERCSLVAALAAPSWLDPATGGPRA